MTEGKKAAETAAKKSPDVACDTVVNCSKSGGHITGMDGERCAVGESVTLPVDVCERLVAAGMARYPTRAETGSDPAQ